MGSELPGFSSPTASFEAPLEMLAACHGRIRDKCAALVKLSAHVAAHGADAAARTAARSVIRYFDSSARHHHDDEEQDLFPALLESMPGSDPVCIRELTSTLVEDHRRLQALWGPIRHWLVAVQGGKAPAADDAAIESFVHLYEQHAVREEQELFPMAERLLGPDELDRIGQAMRLRRGITSV